MITEKATPTPGPWRQNVLLVVDERGNQIAHCTRWPEEAHGPIPDVAEANARLIAAAPEMLAALKALVAVGCLGVISDTDAYRAAWDAIPSLIAKAEGAQ